MNIFNDSFPTSFRSHNGVLDPHHQFYKALWQEILRWQPLDCWISQGTQCMETSGSQARSTATSVQSSAEETMEPKARIEISTEACLAKTRVRVRRSQTQCTRSPHKLSSLFRSVDYTFNACYETMTACVDCLLIGIFVMRRPKLAVEHMESSADCRFERSSISITSTNIGLQSGFSSSAH